MDSNRSNAIAGQRLDHHVPRAHHQSVGGPASQDEQGFTQLVTPGYRHRGSRDRPWGESPYPGANCRISGAGVHACSGSRDPPLESHLPKKLFPRILNRLPDYSPSRSARPRYVFHEGEDRALAATRSQSPVPAAPAGPLAKKKRAPQCTMVPIPFSDSPSSMQPHTRAQPVDTGPPQGVSLCLDSEGAPFASITQPA